MPKKVTQWKKMHIERRELKLRKSANSPQERKDHHTYNTDDYYFRYDEFYCEICPKINNVYCTEKYPCTERCKKYFEEEERVLKEYIRNEMEREKEEKETLLKSEKKKHGKLMRKNLNLFVCDTEMRESYVYYKQEKKL